MYRALSKVRRRAHCPPGQSRAPRVLLRAGEDVGVPEDDRCSGRHLRGGIRPRGAVSTPLVLPASPLGGVLVLPGLRGADQRGSGVPALREASPRSRVLHPGVTPPRAGARPLAERPGCADVILIIGACHKVAAR